MSDRKDADSGYYALIIRAAGAKEIAAGSRPPEIFRKGWLVYTGSAARGLTKRVERHFRADKKFHWHIDYLLAELELKNAVVIRDNDGALRSGGWPGGAEGQGGNSFECYLADRIASLPGGRRVSKRFGSGDCDCEGHLAYFSTNPEKILLKETYKIAASKNRKNTNTQIIRL